MRVASLSDAYGNTATIFKETIIPYRGATKPVDSYKLSLTADYNSDYCYHVSVHDNMQAALDKMNEFSNQTWKGIVFVSNDEFDKLLNKWLNNKSSVQRFSFYTQYEDGSYVCADNEDEEFFVEEFSTKENCLLWLENKDADAWELEHC